MSNDDLEDLRSYAERVNGELRSLFRWARKDLRPAAGGGEILLDAIEDLTLRGGKRLRPYLSHLAAVSIAPEPEIPGLLGASIALELLQTYLLIHDDIMDGDDIRRGGPTVHVLLAEGDAERGRMLGILAGDLAATLARRTLQRAGVQGDRRLRAAEELTWMEWEVIQGQTLDVLGSPDVRTMHDLKTGSYTTRGPVRNGAAIAGAGPEAVTALESYARPLGLAFQLRDDLLDVTGDPGKTGKAVGIDLREGRVSAVIDEARRRADPGQGRRIAAAWGRDDVSPQDLTDALAAIAETGAIEACVERITRWTGEAIEAVESAGMRDEGVTGLRQIARALAARVQ